MVVHGLLIEIGILGLGVDGKEELGKLEHVVGVTGLRSFTVLNVALVVRCCREVLTAAVTAYDHRAVVGYAVPEELGSLAGACIVVQCSHAGVTYGLGYLCVGMLVVQVVAAIGHILKNVLVAETLGGLNVLAVTGNLESIGKNLVHAAELSAGHLLHLVIVQIGYFVQTPVAELYEHALGLLNAGILPRVAQARVHLMYIIPGHPSAAEQTEVTLLKVSPQFLAVGYTAYVAVTVGYLAALQLINHIDQTVIALLVAGSGVVYGQGRYVVSAHMSVQTGPVGEILRLLGQSGLMEERSQQTVGVILQENLYIKVHGVLERAFKQLYLIQVESVVIQFVLRRSACSGQDKCNCNCSTFHIWLGL